jgi:transcriptional regulator with XRE-family HTH domain
MAHVGQEIRRVREARGLNQAQLAVSIGTGPAAISRIENGRQSPSMETLEKIAQGLGVEVADLFPKGQSPLPLEDLPEFTRWALEAPISELETFAATATTVEELEDLRILLAERRAALRATYGSPHPPAEGGGHARLMPAGAEATYWNLVEREAIVQDELRQRKPPPAATITRFAPDHHRLPLVRWLIPEEERGPWKAKLEEELPEGYEEAEAEEVRSAEAVAVEALA